MLSMQKISSVGQASSYFAQADYYTKGEDGVDISSSWYGDGVEMFGLDGQVDPEKFKILLEGHLPDGGKLGKLNNGKEERTPGWDLTFSAPKSLSLLALVSDDKRLIEAHHQAVKAALDEAQEKFIQGRADGEHVHLDKSVFAQFTHTTSRDLDPQLHTHNVLINMGYDGDKARSIDSRVLYDNSMYLGLVYRNELASLVQKLGYDVVWDKKKNLFEIDGIDKETLRYFSERRQEIEKIAKEMGYDNARDMDKATVNSRKSKQSKSKEDVLEHWDKKAKEVGFDGTELVNKSKVKSASLQSPIDNQFGRFKDASSALNYAVKTLSQRESVFYEKNILSYAVEHSAGQYSMTELKHALHMMKDSGYLYQKNSKTEGLYTTKDAARREQYILDLVKLSKNQFSEIASRDEIKVAVDEKTLRVDQENALYKLAQSKDSIIGLQGYAGVGKTYMLDAYIKLAQKNGYDVRGFAPSGEAQEVLGRETGLPTATLQSLLIETQKEKNVEKVTHDPKKIWIVDESSMIPSTYMATLLTEARKRNVRVVLAGDYAQLGAVDAGKPFDQMIHNGMDYGEVVDITRQQKEHLKGAVYDMIDGKTANAFHKLDKHFKQFDSHRDLDKQATHKQNMQDVAKYFASLDSKIREKTLVMIPDNDGRKLANANIREHLKNEGLIDRNEIETETYSAANLEDEKLKYAWNYSEGMAVRFMRDVKRLGVSADSYYTVVGVENDVVKISDGTRVFNWNPSKIAGSKNAVVPYLKDKTNVSKGDKITWKDTNKELGLRNGVKATVTDIKDGKLIVSLDDGSHKEIDLKDPRQRHFEHSYSSTFYSAQGHTYDNAIAVVESWRKNLVNRTSFYVALSRVRNDITFYTDDVAKTQKAIHERLGRKTSGLDILDEIQRTELIKSMEKRELESKVKEVDKTFNNRPSKSMSLEQVKRAGSPKRSKEFGTKRHAFSPKHSKVNNDNNRDKSFDLGFGKGKEQFLP